MIEEDLLVDVDDARELSAFDFVVDVSDLVVLGQLKKEHLLGRAKGRKMR